MLHTKQTTTKEEFKKFLNSFKENESLHINHGGDWDGIDYIIERSSEDFEEFKNMNDEKIKISFDILNNPTPIIIRSENFLYISADTLRGYEGENWLEYLIFNNVPTEEIPMEIIEQFPINEFNEKRDQEIQKEAAKAEGLKKAEAQYNRDCKYFEQLCEQLTQKWQEWRGDAHSFYHKWVKNHYPYQTFRGYEDTFNVCIWGSNNNIFSIELRYDKEKETQGYMSFDTWLEDHDDQLYIYLLKSRI